MICMLSSDPVRPPSASSSSGVEAAQPGAGHEVVQHQEEEEEEINPQHVSTGDQIIGVEHAQKDLSQGRPAVPVPSPPTMTPLQRAIHNLTHQPPHPGCAICRANRSPNMKHGPSHEHERTIPLLVGDYCFLRSIADEHLLTCLVLRLYPYRIFVGCGVPPQGHGPHCCCPPCSRHSRDGACPCCLQV